MINGQNFVGHTKALVIGISHYQDPEIPDLQLPHRDAELFVSFLRSNQMNRIDDENLLLITNSEATSARIATALDWLFEFTAAEDTIILYFAGYGMDQRQKVIPPSTLYFYDTPYNLSDAGSFDLFLQFQALAEKKKCEFKIFGNIYPLVLAPELRDDSLIGKQVKSVKKTYQHVAFVNTVEENTYTKTFQELSTAKVSLSHLLLDGMYGLADQNEDQFISFKELRNFLNEQKVIPEIWPGLLFICASSKYQMLAMTDPLVLNTLNQMKDPVLSAFVNSETKNYETSFLQKLSDENRLLYQDFIVAIKLGHLLLPVNRNASSLADSLLKQKEFAPLYGEIRRKLAAAYQDETQQALNAYLNSDSREIARRRKGNDQYGLYPKYLQNALDLLGDHHYMSNILKAKRFYFEGLHKRLDGQIRKNEEFIREALAFQLKALAFENEAAFIYNEIAINYSLLKQREEAKENFQSAIELSPAWGIPFTNLAQYYSFEDLPKALRIAKHAIRLSPRNSFAYSIEGAIYMQSKDYANAENSFSKALKLDPSYSEVFYNLACLKSLQGDYGAALLHFESAIQNGFLDIEHALLDPDLVGLREQSEWKKLMEKLKINN